ncbi:MAG TPA: hypothetical protein VGE98_08990, partial [Thermoanaerobaculia bacterium]
MAAPTDSLPAILLHHAAVRPHVPWLFFADGWDWRWRSFSEAAAQVARWTAELLPLPEGTVAAFDGRPSPRSVLLDLAIQGAGLVAAPDGGVGAPPSAVRVAFAEDSSAEAGSPEATPTIRLTADAVPAWRGAASEPAVALAGARPAGGVVVGSEAGPAVVSQRDLAVQAERVAALLPSPSAEREIAVCSRPPADPIARGL